MSIKIVVNPFLTYTGQQIFKSMVIMLNLHSQQLDYKDSECLDVHGNTSVTLCLASSFDVQFCRSHEQLLPLVDLLTHCLAVDLIDNYCVSNPLCLHSLSS